MKQRSKYVLEGAITELVHNEYDRILSIDDMMVTIDNQKYLGSVTEYEGKQCADILARVKELKDEEITLLQTLSRNLFAYVRPENTNTNVNAETSTEMEGQVTMDEVEQANNTEENTETAEVSTTGTAAELNTDRAMKGIEEYSTDNVVSAEAVEEKGE